MILVDWEMVTRLKPSNCKVPVMKPELHKDLA